MYLVILDLTKIILQYAQNIEEVLIYYPDLIDNKQLYKIYNHNKYYDLLNQEYLLFVHFSHQLPDNSVNRVVSNVMSEAIRRKYISTICYLFFIGKTCNETTLANLIEYGEIKLIIMLYYLGIQFTQSHAETAGVYGQIEVFKFFISIGIECDSDMVGQICSHGHVNIMKYLHFIGIDCIHINDFLAYSIMYDQENMIKYLESIGAELTIDSYQYLNYNHNKFNKYIKNRVKKQGS